jgi:hypothetical protein
MDVLETTFGDRLPELLAERLRECRRSVVLLVTTHVREEVKTGGEVGRIPRSDLVDHRGHPISELLGHEGIDRGHGRRKRTKEYGAREGDVTSIRE